MTVHARLSPLANERHDSGSTAGTGADKGNEVRTGMTPSLLPDTPRARRAILALALALLALVGAAFFTDPASQRAGATTPDPDGTVISLTCEVINEVIGCKLISARDLEREEGVRFVISVGGETQTVSATRDLDGDGGLRFVVSIGGETQTTGVIGESDPVVGAGWSCGEDDGSCYVFSFTPHGSGGGDVQVSEVVAIAADAAPPVEDHVAPPEPRQQAATPPQSDQAAESQLHAVTDTSPANDPPLRAESVHEPPPADQAEAKSTGDAGSEATVADTAEPDQRQIDATDADQAPQLTPAEIARRQREHERRMAEDEQQLQEVDAEIRKRQDEGDWPERDPDTPVDEMSDAELEAELKVHEELHQQREAERQAERENRFPAHPGADSDIVVLDFPTEDGDGNLPPGAFQEWTVELHELLDAGEPFLVCDHNEVGPDGGPLCTWENQ